MLGIPRSDYNLEYLKESECDKQTSFTTSRCLVFHGEMIIWNILKKVKVVIKRSLRQQDAFRCMVR